MCVYYMLQQCNFDSLCHASAGRSSLADDILSNKFKEIAPIFGSKIEGKDKFKSTIDGLFSVSFSSFPMSTFRAIAMH